MAASWASSGSSRLLAALVTVTLLAGCENAQRHTSPASVAPQQIEVGSKLTPRAPMIFAAGTAALYFQGNQVVGRAEIARDLPYCRLTRTSVAGPWLIEATALTVQSINYDKKDMAAIDTAVNVTRIELFADPKQPGYTFSCQWPAGGPSQSFLTPEEIRGAIGSLFLMTLAE